MASKTGNKVYYNIILLIIFSIISVIVFGIGKYKWNISIKCGYFYLLFLSYCKKYR